MAKPIPFTLPPRDPRAELLQKLEHAPAEHAEALLDAYAILQLLREKGLLEIAKGALGSGEKVLGILTKTLESDELVRTIRNLTIFAKIIGSVDPEKLETVVEDLSRSLTDAQVKKPPGLFGLLRRFSSAESRRALVPAAAVLETLGRNMPLSEASEFHKKKRKKTFRHSA